MSETERVWYFERDETGMIVRMIWGGDRPKQHKPPCMFEFDAIAAKSSR